MKKIYIARHGETEMNAKGIWQGQTIDVSLNNEGRRQAKDLADILKDKSIEIIYTSPMKRAFETAEIIGDICNIKTIKENGLIEGHFGVAEGKTKETIGKHIHVYKRWISLEEENMDVFFEGGESKRQIQKRAIEAINNILQSPHKNIAVVCHSMIVRLILLHLGLSLQKIPNAGYFLLEFDGQNLKIAD